MADNITSKLYSHYRNSTIDALLVSKVWNLSPALFSATKYIQRAGKKSGNSFEADMLKAVWYLIYETASKVMPHDVAVILSDELIQYLSQSCRDYECHTSTDAEQDSSNSQCGSDSQEIPTPG